MHTTWTYNGKSFTLDLNDVTGLSRYDEALAAQRSAFTELPLQASEPRQLIAYCEGIRRLLDTLFGEGTTKMLLGDSAKPTDHDDLYESFLDFVHDQTAADAERREKLIRKYKPDPNREQRRALEHLADRITAKQ